jgi:hypothetical protein
VDTYSHVLPGMQEEAAAIVAGLVADAAVGKTLADGSADNAASANVVALSRGILEPAGGIEPSTCCLQDSCSAN